MDLGLDLSLPTWSYRLNWGGFFLMTFHETKVISGNRMKGP